MSNHLDPTNFSALQFNIESADIMSRLCESLLNEELGIIIFTYCRTFNNGTRLYLCSDPEWVKHYVNHNFQDDVEHLESYAPGDELKYALWTGFKEDKVFSTLREHFNRWHGFSIYEKNENYIDSFDFTARKDAYQVTNYYLNNIDRLNQLIKDFKEQASNLIDPSDKRKLMVSKIWKPFNNQPRNSLLEPNKMEDFIKQVTIK